MSERNTQNALLLATLAVIATVSALWLSKSLHARISSAQIRRESCSRGETPSKREENSDQSVSGELYRVPFVEGFQDSLPSSPTTRVEEKIKPQFEEVLEAPLRSVDMSVVQLRATPGRFRLLDCAAFLDEALLRVIEFPQFDLLQVPYAAISYPWRDLQLPDGAKPPEGSFSVHGAEHADRITIAVLRTACLAARYFGTSYLWLDRLCMIQSSKPDKIWQIERMHTIYTHCNPCLVLPGGLVRLACLDEPTTWIDRAWTLQEIAANPKRSTAKCVYSFPYASFTEFSETFTGSGYTAEFKSHLDNTSQAIFTQHILEPRHSAGCDLVNLLTKLQFMLKAFQILDPHLSKDLHTFPIRLISAAAGRLVKKSVIFDSTINHQFFWQSAFVRSSSRPVDMVFSIMGPMGVQLNVADFEAHDRTKATIKLIQALLSQGHPAIWLFIAPELPPAPEYSLLPLFPETSVSGRAMLHMPAGRTPALEVIGLQESWEIDGAPKGTMSDDGYFHFSTRAAPVNDSQTLGRDVWAVVVGRRKELNRNPENGLISTSNSRHKPFPPRIELTLMFVERHAVQAGRRLYRRIGMEREINEADTTKWAWVEREIDVGGPGGGDRVRFTVRDTGPVYATADDISRENAPRLPGGVRVIHSGLP